MIPRRARWALGSFVLAVAAVGAAFAPRTIARRRAQGPASSKRVGSTYVLAVESDVQKKLNEIRHPVEPVETRRPAAGGLRDGGRGTRRR